MSQFQVRKRARSPDSVVTVPEKKGKTQEAAALTATQQILPVSSSTVKRDPNSEWVVTLLHGHKQSHSTDFDSSRLSDVAETVFGYEVAPLQPFLRLAWVRDGHPATLTSLIHPEHLTFLSVADYVSHFPPDFSLRTVAQVTFQCRHLPPLPVVISHETTYEDVDAILISFWRKESKEEFDEELGEFWTTWFEDGAFTTEMDYAPCTNFLFVWAAYGLKPVIHCNAGYHRCR